MSVFRLQPRIIKKKTQKAGSVIKIMLCAHVLALFRVMYCTYSEVQLHTSLKKEANLNTEPRSTRAEQIFRIVLTRFHDHHRVRQQRKYYDSRAPNEPSVFNAPVYRM